MEDAARPVSGQTHLERKLKTRHLSMIAIGGTIGTGLFLASGSIIHTAGPGGAVAAYLVAGVMVYFLMTSLAEMAAFIPITGSFSTYTSRFVDPALGFAIGWNYWYNNAIVVALELAASSLIMKYWLPGVPGIVWSALFLALIFGLNILSVKGYGESEFWFAIIKVATIIIFLAVGVLMIFGIMHGNSAGFENFTKGPAPFNGGIFSILGVFMVVGFAFQGTELVGIAAGESENPKKNIPKAIKQIFWRLLLFYVLAIIVIGFLISYDDPRLLSTDIQDIAVSPFTLVFKNAGFAMAASVMNAVILTSVLSAGNSAMYGASRVLWVLAKEGKAPSFLKKVNAGGVPANAVYFSAIIGMAAFLTSLFGEGTVYTWLLNAAGLSGFLSWLGISITHYRFRKAYLAQGRALHDLPYVSKWFPLGPILATVLCLTAIFGQNYAAFFETQIDWYGILVSYIGLPLFLLAFLGYKMIKKTKMVPLQKADFNQD
ncbi:amino acid permease [Fictibacillus sp. CENA-BCM004]|uniref:Amino acid permease n=2 Tax=Fictibacillus terranigra TaxID=3058424 RepID=A0ABT8EAZ1_9BACL|nr:amino acid permease [Fictibacillus sp. CENA-BCM004]MDN4075086.1 amino acid permease [Fictibacillus sp. CENA-BCM004]